MATCRQELIDLQAKARRAGRVCTFFFNENGEQENAVFYRDPRAKGPCLRNGMIIPLLSFAEKERAALDVWQNAPGR